MGSISGKCQEGKCDCKSSLREPWRDSCKNEGAEGEPCTCDGNWKFWVIVTIGVFAAMMILTALLYPYWKKQHDLMKSYFLKQHATPEEASAMVNAVSY